MEKENENRENGKGGRWQTDIKRKRETYKVTTEQGKGGHQVRTVEDYH